MTMLDYVDVPAYATPLQPSSSTSSSSSPRPTPKVTTSLPQPDDSPSAFTLGTPTSPPGASGTGAAPSKLAFNLPALLLSSALPAGAVGNSDPRAAAGPVALLSARDPLSIPITTVNFRRFVSKVGPVFWLQDRIEEVVMWRKGWRVTAVWMAAYAFLCTFEPAAPFARMR
jgi:hypothetical protein